MNTDIQNYVLSLQEVEANSDFEEITPLSSGISIGCTVNHAPSGASWFFC